MKVAIVGATGLVGSKMLSILEERNFPLDKILPVASAKSIGQRVRYRDNEFAVMSFEEAIAAKPAIALFSAGSAVSLEWAPKFAEAGIRVVDNSSAWRMDPQKKLVVPEVNAQALGPEDFIIANPNCSTIQMVVMLKPLHDQYQARRVVVSTYQSVSGTGQKAVKELMDQRTGTQEAKVYPYPIDLNLLPQIDVFLENGYTKEEMKMTLETKKIMGDDSIKVTATCVRVPVVSGHSESINIEFEKPFALADIKKILSQAPGVTLWDDVSQNKYPMPLYVEKSDEVFVGRLRRDESQEHTLHAWVVANNLRKGAATNAIQIAEYLLLKGWIK